MVERKNVEFKRFRQQKKLIYFLMMSMLIPFLAAATTTITILYQLIEKTTFLIAVVKAQKYTHTHTRSYTIVQ